MSNRPPSPSSPALHLTPIHVKCLFGGGGASKWTAHSCQCVSLTLSSWRRRPRQLIGRLRYGGHATAQKRRDLVLDSATTRLRPARVRSVRFYETLDFPIVFLQLRTEFPESDNCTDARLRSILVFELDSNAHSSKKVIF